MARNRSFVIVAGTLGAGAITLVHGLGYYRLTVDDAYITFRYASNLANGLGPNWNSDGRVEGYTSFLWMLALAGTEKLSISPVIASQMLGFFAIIATFLIAYRVWVLWSADEPGSGIDHPLVPTAAVLGLSLVGGLSFWGYSGMETPLFTALVAGGVCLCLTERRTGGLPWSAVVLAAAAMTRPEGLIVVVVSGAFKAWLLFRQDRSQRAVINAALWVSMVGFLYGAYFLWRLTYYDEWLPNTFYAKVGATRALLDRGLVYVQEWGLRYHVLPAAIGALFLLSLERIRADAVYILGVTAALLAGIAIEGADSFGHGRFMVPLLPLLYLAGAAGYAVLLRRVRLPAAQTALIAAVALTFAGLALVRSSQDDSMAIQRRGIEDRQLLGEWLSDHAPEDYTVAAFAIGGLGYYVEQDMLDLLGVNDRVIAHTEVIGLGSGIAGHEKYNTDYVFEQAQPELIVPGDSEGQAFTDEELRALLSGSTIPARDSYLHDPRLWERYTVRSVQIEGRWFNLLQRRDLGDDLAAAAPE